MVIVELLKLSEIISMLCSKLIFSRLLLLRFGLTVLIINLLNSIIAKYYLLYLILWYKYFFFLIFLLIDFWG